MLTANPKGDTIYKYVPWYSIFYLMVIKILNVYMWPFKMTATKASCSTSTTNDIYFLIITTNDIYTHKRKRFGEKTC